MMSTEVSGSTGSGEQIREESQSKKIDKMMTQTRDKEKVNDKHRMTRKKRRRLEAAKALQNEKEIEVILVWFSCVN